MFFNLFLNFSFFFRNLFIIYLIISKKKSNIFLICCNLWSQQNNKKNNNSGQQPSISITPLPRQSAQNTTTPTASMSNAHQSIPANAKAGMKPGQSPSGNKASFVICEICDGYIKDLEQLRNHMQWMHKVKV